jgi:putative membrane protein
MVWGMIMMVLFWGGLIALLIWGVQSLVRREDPRSPLDIAKERLARGEITAQEFEQIRQALESK